MSQMKPDLKAFNVKSPLVETFEAVIKACLAKDTAKTLNDAYVDIYKRLRDGDMATADNAKKFIDSLFTAERYDLSPVGRFRFNKRFEKGMDEVALSPPYDSKKT